MDTEDSAQLLLNGEIDNEEDTKKSSQFKFFILQRKCELFESAFESNCIKM